MSPTMRKSEREQIRQKVFLALDKEDLEVYQIAERFGVVSSTASHYLREYKKAKKDETAG